MKFIISSIFVFLGAVMYLLPTLTRRGFLFAVPLSPEFRQGATARRCITTFRAWVAGATFLGLCAVFFAPQALSDAVAGAGPLFIVVAGISAFIWQNRKLAPFAVQASRRREVDVSVQPERLPWFTWLTIGPFVALGAAALFLQMNRARIPARFPVHWDINGQPNGWNEKTFLGVYGPLLFAAELCAWLIVLTLAMWFGSRRSRLRRIVTGGMVAVEYLLGFLFAALGVDPIIKIPVWIPVLVPLFFFVPLLIVLAREINHDPDPPESTPNDRWKAGFIYYNPDDSALMVEKRTGLGYTFNFANPWSWGLMSGLLVVVGSVFFLL